MVSNFTGTCTELPIQRNLITDSIFPLRKGAEVFVDCAEGFTLTSGDRMITCEQDSEFSTTRELPTCNKGRWNIVLR